VKGLDGIKNFNYHFTGKKRMPAIYILQ